MTWREKDELRKMRNEKGKKRRESKGETGKERGGGAREKWRWGRGLFRESLRDSVIYAAF
jgi:hypothetical protein